MKLKDLTLRYQKQSKTAVIQDDYYLLYDDSQMGRRVPTKYLGKFKRNKSGDIYVNDNSPVISEQELLLQLNKHAESLDYDIENEQYLFNGSYKGFFDNVCVLDFVKEFGFTTDMSEGYTLKLGYMSRSSYTYYISDFRNADEITIRFSNNLDSYTYITVPANYKDVINAILSIILPEITVVSAQMIQLVTRSLPMIDNIEEHTLVEITKKGIVETDMKEKSKQLLQNILKKYE